MFTDTRGTCAADWMFVSPSNSCWNLIPNVMLLVGGASGRWSGHENRTLTNEIGSLMKETPECFLALSTRWRHSEKTAVHEPGNRLSSDCRYLSLGFPSSRTVRTKFLLFINHFRSGICYRNPDKLRQRKKQTLETISEIQFGECWAVWQCPLDI